MVRLLSQDTTTGIIFFRSQLPPHMLLIDHISRSNPFPLQYIVQRRGAILEALHRISKGLWFSPVELVMTSLFHFEDKFHHRNLTKAKSMPLLFPLLLCQVSKHIGFPIEPRLQRRRDCDAILTVDWWQTRPRAFHLPPPVPTKDQPATDFPVEEQLSLTVHTKEN